MLRSRPPALSSLPVLRFSLFADLPHGISMRQGGVSEGPYATLNVGLSTGDREDHVLANRRAFVESLGIEPETVVMGRFTHGNAVSVFRRSPDGELPTQRVPVRAGSWRTEAVFKSDAVVSDVPGLHFFLTFADCVPLAFRDRQGRVVGAAHAGWRGTAWGIGPAVVRTMNQTLGAEPRDVLVAIGPSIGPCCYSVRPEVLDTFRAHGFDPVVEERDGVMYLDLWTTNEGQLRQSGVPAESIENCRICTSCNVDTFYSHRAERGRTGRFALCLGATEAL